MPMKKYLVETEQGYLALMKPQKCFVFQMKGGVTNSDDYLARIEINHNSQYQVKGYDIDEETKIAKLIAITMRLRANDPGVINDSSEMALCTSSKKIVDSEGQVKTEIAFLSEKKCDEICFRRVLCSRI